MIADRVLRVGEGYDFNAELPVALNAVRVDSHISFDTEDDDNFKPRVQSAIQQVEAETKLKIFPGRFIAQWTYGKVASHGNSYRPLTFPGLEPVIIEKGESSQTNVDFTSLMRGYDSNGNMEIYPNSSWPLQTITVEFTAGIPTNESPRLTFSNPDLRQLIGSICGYMFYQDKEQLELIKFLFERISYASRDNI